MHLLQGTSVPWPPPLRDVVVVFWGNHFRALVRLAELPGPRAPLVLQNQRAHRVVQRLGCLDRVPRVGPLQEMPVPLDEHRLQDAEDVSAEGVAVERPGVVAHGEASDPVLSSVRTVLGVVGVLADLAHEVRVELERRLDAAENDVPDRNGGLALLDFDRRGLERCYSLNRVEQAVVTVLHDGPHAVPRARVEYGSGIEEGFHDHDVPEIPTPQLLLPRLRVSPRVRHLGPVLVERGRRLVRVLQNHTWAPSRLLRQVGDQLWGQLCDLLVDRGVTA